MTSAHAASAADDASTTFPEYLRVKAGDASGDGAPEAERMRRLRRDFSLDASAMLKKIQAVIPDATEADLEKWTRGGSLQWLTLDGEVRYFRREPANLVRFNKGAKARKGKEESKAVAADPSLRDTSRFILNDHLSDAVRASQTQSTTTVLPVRFRVEHVIRVKPGVVPKGEMIRCWMPFPQDYRHQRGGKNLRTQPEGHRTAANGVPMRTVYMEQPSAGDTTETVFRAEYEYASADYLSGVGDKGSATDLSNPETSTALESRPPHLELTPQVRALAASIVGEATDPVEKARRIWLWMDKNIGYCSEMEYAIIPRIVEKIVVTRRGDCGVQALLFIALCRASGVPARWQSGWVTRPGGWNMHDWAEFWADDTLGWVPADPSAGVRSTAKEDTVRYFFFGGIDAYRMIANLDYGRPFDPPKQHWASDPVDNQRGEVEWSGGNLYYDAWDYDVKVEAF